MPAPSPEETGDDQLFRELIVEFSADFVRLLAPDIASQLDLSDLEFELCEYFSDSPRGGRPRRPDLAASAPRLDDPERRVNLHAEVENQYRKLRVPRLLDYNRLLALRNSRPTHTFVVYVHGGPAGTERRLYCEESLRRTTVLFEYDSLGCSRASAEAFLGRQEPLAWAFAALMRPGRLGSRARLRVACLRRIIDAKHLSESQRFKLFNFVASYIESDQGQGLSEEYDELFRRDEEVKETMISWADKMIAKGRKLGRDEERRLSVSAMRDLVIDLVKERFGSVSPKVEQWVSRIDSLQELRRLAKRIVAVASQDELLLREKPA